MKIATIIKMLRETHGMTQSELAKIAGVSDKAVSTWETGINIPRMGAIQKIADYFGVSKSYIIGDADDQASTVLRVPVLGTIPAGIPIEAIEDVLDWEEIPQSWARGGKEFFALKISGRSMWPRYEDGDIIIVRRQYTCESGQDCVVMVNGEDATFKRVRRDEHGIALVPINSDFDIATYTNQQIAELPVRILGVAVEIRRKL